MNTPASETTSTADTSGDDLAQGLISVLVLVLALGLLAAAQSVALPWMPFQGLLLCALLCALAVANGRSHLPDGAASLNAASSAARVRQAIIAAVALIVVALPSYQYRQSAGGADANRFPLTVALALVLCMLVVSMSSSLLDCWSALHVQAWERRLVPDSGWTRDAAEGAGRVDRAAILTILWRWWLTGVIALALALLLCARPGATGPAWVTPAGLVAFVSFLVAGLAALGEAARRRQAVYWQLEGIAVAPALHKQWNTLTIGMGLSVIAACALLLVLRVLDGVHAIEYWVLWQILAPLADALVRFFTRHGGSNNCSGTSCSGPSPFRTLQPHPRPAQHTQPSTGSLDLSWLAQHWPVALAAVALAVLAGSYLAGRRGGARTTWYGGLVALARLLAGLLRRPFRLLARDVAAQMGQQLTAIVSAASRRAGRQPSQGNRQTIIALYLAALRYGKRHGVPHYPAQTPREYASTLADTLPAQRDTIQDMTTLFVEVRYGDRSPDDGSVARMRALWKTLRH